MIDLIQKLLESQTIQMIDLMDRLHKKLSVEEII